MKALFINIGKNKGEQWIILGSYITIYSAWQARSQTSNNVNCIFCSRVILFHVVFAHWPIFHVTNPNGKKFMQDDVADRIQQVVDLQNQSQTIFTLTIFMLVHFLYNLALKLGWCLFDIFLFIPLITTFNNELSWFLYAFMLLKFSIFSLELCEFMTLNIFYSTICHYLWME